MTHATRRSEFKTLESLDERRRFIARCYDGVARSREGWIRRRRYYYAYLTKVLRFLVAPGQRVLQIKCETGFYLNAVKPSRGVGLDSSAAMIGEARRLRPSYTFDVSGLEEPKVEGPFDAILCVNALGDIVDVRRLFENLRSVCHRGTRLVIINYNALWKPLLILAGSLRLKILQPAQNWLSPDDIRSLLHLSGYETVKSFNVLLCPAGIPVVSWFLNDIVARLPLVQYLCLDHVLVARPLGLGNDALPASVSVVVPCRNERENIASIVQRMPDMGRGTELIFSDDRSNDKTADEVRRLMALHPEKNIKLVAGPGLGKARNVWTGFGHATGDILMIFDADATVIPEELPYFYEALTRGKGDFINGSRLIYPMAEDAMPYHKMLGNKMFSVLFSYVLGQRIKDTLCGTKVFWRDDYERMRAHFGAWGPEDRWGDYDLLFSATKLNLKIVDLPVHYFDRVHGTTKMSNVVTHGARMMIMVLVALKKLKFF